ncbi:MAG: nitrogenase component 1 [Clostridia bacterium]|nr:nitrogenase component 1 [Clostridia bacterium]
MKTCLENPAVSCAMTGACAVLSGFKGLSVVVHGSSGCYYYPKSVLKVPLYSTLLLESEIVLGTVERLHEVVSELEKAGKTVAVVNTCIPALTGDDLSGAFVGCDALFVDAPGYIGNADAGVSAAYKALDIPVNPETAGVNIDGVLPLDLFSRGNLHEAERLLSLMGIPVALKLASDTYERVKAGAAPYSISVNPSWDSGVGTSLGSFLFPDLKETASHLAEVFPDALFDRFYEELSRADETMFYYADKYLRKYTPPVVAVVSEKSYCDFAEKMLSRYFGSDVPVKLPREEIYDSAKISAAVSDAECDLLLASSYEASSLTRKDAAFVGITHPDRSRVSMSAAPLSGIEGGIYFMERCINALIDAKKAV